jgi:hypothetical protein
MPDDHPEELRTRVRELIDNVSRTPDRQLKQKLASAAFDLAQRAEAIERQHQGSDGSTPVLSEQLKSVAESNMQRFAEQLYVERDDTQRELYRNLLLAEERWFGAKQERLEILQRLLRDCDGRVTRYTALLDGQQASGVAADQARQLLDNILDTQRFLRIQLRKELARQGDVF